MHLQKHLAKKRKKSLVCWFRRLISPMQPRHLLQIKKRMTVAPAAVSVKAKGASARLNMVAESCMLQKARQVVVAVKRVSGGVPLLLMRIKNMGLQSLQRLSYAKCLFQRPLPLLS